MKAIYAGSFDPLTNGHMDIIKRGAALFPELVVAVGVNPSKQPLLTPETRVRLIQRSVEDAGLTNVQVTSFFGLLANFAMQQGAKVLLRGLRPLGDFDKEFQMSMVNNSLAPNLETLFIPTALDTSYVSSSLVKELMNYGAEIDHLVPAAVTRYRETGHL